MASGTSSGEAVAVSVIVPAYNAATTLPRSLATLAEQDLDAPFEVIVVDDGSRDGSPDLTAATAGPIRVLRQGHRGPGPARNLGAAEARGSVLAFTDADCFPSPSWLREGLRAIANADLVQGPVSPDPGAAAGPFDHTVHVPRESGLYETANLFVRRELFERIGGFEDWLEARVGKPLAEDAWFGWRARRAGASTAFCDEALVHHAVLPRGIRDYALERLRLQYFPALAQRIPELRRRLFFGRVFLSTRSAAFDLALAGAVAAIAFVSPVPLAAVLPYGASVLRRALRWRAARVIPGELLADVVGFVALVWGSVRYRSPVL